MGSRPPAGRLRLFLPPEQTAGRLGAPPRLRAQQRLLGSPRHTGETPEAYLLPSSSNQNSVSVLGKFDLRLATSSLRHFPPAGSGRQRFGPVQSRRAVAEQRGPRRSPAGALSRLPDQMADGGKTSLPDESDGRRHCHPGEREPPAELRLVWELQVCHRCALLCVQSHWRRFVEQRVYRRRLQFLYMNWRAVVKVTAAVPNHVTEIRLAGAAHLIIYVVCLCEQIQAFARMWLARRRYCARLSFFRRNVSCCCCCLLKAGEHSSSLTFYTLCFFKLVIENERRGNLG